MAQQKEGLAVEPNSPPELEPLDRSGGGGWETPADCPQTSTQVPWYVHAHKINTCT